MCVAFWAAAVALFRFISLSAGAYQARKRFNCSGPVPPYPFYIQECTLRHVFRFYADECTLREVECCFTSTETAGLLGTGAQDGHLDFHTAPELWLYARFRYSVLYRRVHVMSCIPVQYRGMHFMPCIPVQYKGMHCTSCIPVQYRLIHFTSCIPVQYRLIHFTSCIPVQYRGIHLTSCIPVRYTGMHWLYGMYSGSRYIYTGMHFTSCITVLYMDLVLYKRELCATYSGSIPVSYTHLRAHETG